MYYFNPQLDTAAINATPDLINQMNCHLYTQYGSNYLQLQRLKQKCHLLELENQRLRQKVISHQIARESQQNPSRRIPRIVRRRTENQLQKQFKCPYLRCKKQYASQLALNLHIKIKHNGGTKLQRLMLAKSIIAAESYGVQLKNIPINLPPNYIQNYKQQYKTKNQNNMAMNQKNSVELSVKIEQSLK